MGLKQDLIDAKVEALKIQGVTNPPVEKGSPIEVEAELTKQAIVNFLTKADFRVTQMNAPVVIEDFNIPDQSCNVSMTTLLGPHGPVIDSIKKIAGLVPGAAQVVSILEEQVQRITKPLLEGGTTLPGINLDKTSGLKSEGYVYVGTDPESKRSFDVSDEGGQKAFTKVKLFNDDIGSIV